LPYPMIDELDGRWLLADGQLLPADGLAAAAYFVPSDIQMFYEVIRITQSIPLFWEDHLARLVASVDGRLPIPDSLCEESRRLIQANGVTESNLRIVLSAEGYVIHQTPSYYPSDNARHHGVPTGILHWERQKPNTKAILADYKAAVAGRFAQPGPFGRYFELLLADHEGYLTEGSRSNLFFIQQHQVLSAPDDRILKGITRKYILVAVAMANLTLRDSLLNINEIQNGSCDAAFLTGSPIDILPIRSIEGIELASGDNPDLIRISQAYNQIVDAYIREHPGQP
jgi:branched-chain amino acid aminotransferase